MMKRTWTRRALAPALALLIPIGEPAMALVTQSINYQGFLTDKVTGLPIEGAKDMEFAFYLAATGGGAQFTETRCASASKAVSVVKGRYQVEIGSNTAGGITQTLFTANPNIWLEVRVDPDDNCASFEVLAPRVRMQAAPYAFEALHASTATHLAVVGDMPGVSVSSHLFVVNGSSVGIGTLSPEAALHIVGVSSITASITVGGVDNASVPRGAVMFFNLAACPTGWVALIAARGRYLVGLPSGGTLAGTDGTALTDLEDRPVGQHNHATTDPGHAHNFVGDATGTDTVPGGDAGAASTSGSYAGIVASNTTGITVNNAGSVAGTPAPYLQLLVCQKN